ncbi:hypothetical protein GCM10027511_38560 [Hymenobacter humi]
MPRPEQNPTDPRPDLASTSTGGETPSQDTDRDQNATGNPEAGTAADGAMPTESTQQNMGDGAGIRGEYGTASQTNGMEGGDDQPLTDTELTGS